MTDTLIEKLHNCRKQISEQIQAYGGSETGDLLQAIRPLLLEAIGGLTPKPSEEVRERVRPLHWQEPNSKNNYCHIAETPIGIYYVHVDGGKHHAFFDFGGFDMINEDSFIGEPSGTLEIEQQKCQDHYEKFIAANVIRQDATGDA